MLITDLPAQRYHPVALQGGEESPTGPLNEFEVIDRSAPGIEENCSRFEIFSLDGLPKYFLKSVVFGFLIRFRIVDSVVDG